MELVESEESGSLWRSFEGLNTCRIRMCVKQSSEDAFKGVVIISPGISKNLILVSPNTIHKSS